MQLQNTHRIAAITFWLLALLSFILTLPYWSYYLHLYGRGIVQNEQVFYGWELFPPMGFLELKIPVFSTIFEIACVIVGVVYWWWPFQGRWQPLAAALSWLCTLSAMLIIPFSLKSDVQHEPAESTYSLMYDPFSQKPLPPELYLHVDVSIFIARLFIILALLGLLCYLISLAGYFIKKRTNTEDIIDL